MKTSILAASAAAAILILTQTVEANPPGRGGGFSAMPHFSSARQFARPAPMRPAPGITASRPVINTQRTQPAARYVQPRIVTGSHLPPRTWATNPNQSRPATTTTTPPRTATTAPATRNTQTNNNRIGFAEASRRYTHAWHDRNWWRSRYSNIVLVDGGYYYWDSGYWFPAWGYDASSNTYPYDGPIYGFDGLNPDQVVADVQAQLQRDGYYNGPVNGILDQPTQVALANYQRDNNLAVTSVVDAATVQALGLS
jgi:peptidoglycan hydrolase-like protein with peptidoglycan-binding domain